MVPLKYKIGWLDSFTSKRIPVASGLVAKERVLDPFPPTTEMGIEYVVFVANVTADSPKLRATGGFTSILIDNLSIDDD